MNKKHIFVATALTVFAIPLWSSAGIVVYSLVENSGLAGFNSAAGNPPVSIDFDSISPGTDIGGLTIAGVTFTASSGGAPLLVVNGNATFTPGGFSGVIDPNTNKLFPTSGQNVLSPGGTNLGPGPNAAIENDDLELIFGEPLSAFGFDHLSQSADGASYTHIKVFNQTNALIYAGLIPISNFGGGGAPGGADFFGMIATAGDLISRIVIDEQDANELYPDSNIGFDTFRFVPQSSQLSSVPEPSSLVVFGFGMLVFVMAFQGRCGRNRRKSLAVPE